MRIHAAAVTAFAVVLTAVVACRSAGTGPGGGATDGTTPGPTSPGPTVGSGPGSGGDQPGGVENADLVGTFGGDERLEGGCAWINGDDGERYEVVYPEGWSVEFDPVRLIDPAGEVRAEEGDRIGVNGEVAADAVSICQIGPIFQATDVVTDD